jgi:hypothetical protein
MIALHDKCAGLEAENERLRNSIKELEDKYFKDQKVW